MKTKLTALAFLLLPTISTPAFAAFTLTADGFTNNGDGTVTDENTGLVWQACAVGQTFNNSTGSCDGEAKTYTYENALKLTSDFAGQTDWRIPNIAELHTLVDLKKFQPAVNKSLFPQTPKSYFLTSSIYTPSPSSQWVVLFDLGADNVSSSGNVRFVRGSTVSPVISLKDFVDNGDGTVTHNKTGLTWQRCSVGQTWNDGSCDGKAAGYKQADALKLTANTGGKSDWHLPTYKELLTIVDYSAVNPAINVVVFPDAPSTYFWTSTQTAGDGYTNYAWCVIFENGQGFYNTKDNNMFAARLVRGSMTNSTTTTTPTGSVDLTAALSASPSPAKINQTLTYSATVTNKGKATATGTTLTFYVAPKFMSYTASSNGCELKNNGLSVVCNIGELAAGANVTKTMNVIMQKSGGVSSSVFAKSNETDANPADNIGRTATGVKK